MRISVIAVLGLMACNGDKSSSKTGETGTAGSDTSTTPATGGFALNAVATNVNPPGPAAEGLCGTVFDPTPALSGGDPLALATATVGAGGALAFTDIVTTSGIGLLVDVRDCDTAATTTVFPSATGVAATAYAGKGEGDTVDGGTAFSIDSALFAGLTASAPGGGYAGDLGAAGFLWIFVVDGTGAPIGGATASCTGTCPDPMYLDADPSDGLFSTGATANTATDAAAGGAVIFPAGPITQYSADDGGAHTFTPQLNGSNPAIATFTGLTGE